MVSYKQAAKAELHTN